MSSKPLYMDNCYLKEWDAKVIKAEDNRIILDQTAFYPRSGGVECDKGFIIQNGKKVPVKEVIKQGNEIIHILEDKIERGDVHCSIDWERRYRLMRMHTAAHVLSAVLYKEENALITGNKIDVNKSRIDFNLKEFNKERILELVNKANQLIEEKRNVKIYYLPRDKAMEIEGIVKLASKLPPSIEKLRIVEIEGIDIQADGGCHVKNTQEIGKIVFLKAENKGKGNRRIYFTVE